MGFSRRTATTAAAATYAFERDEQISVFGGGVVIRNEGDGTLS